MDVDRLFDKLQDALFAESNKRYSGYSPKTNKTPCCIEGCPNAAVSHGLCNAHYLRKKNGKDLYKPLKNNRRVPDKPCSECGVPIDSKGGWGLCKAHYTQRRRELFRRVCVAEMGDKCARCGQSFPDYVYDFHHRDPSEKEGSPGDVISKWSMRRMAEEVVKCDLLCANCHRITHNDERKLSVEPPSDPAV